ncbi:MAG TPA: hypothetical protein PK712_01415, partial [Rectinema sp.]|nr:hypothetical protein [Rectinema sp.]
MKYYANSVFEYIRDKVDLIPDISNENKKLLFMIPVLPSVAAINVCRLVEGLCLELGSRVTSTIKIAHGLCNEWRDSEFDFDKNAFREAKEHGWYDETGNLTRYRNAQANIVLLIGTDRVTDSSSLSDFHRCDVGAIWDEWLQSSFAQWIEKRLEEASVGYEESTVAHFDQILKPLMNSGLADILQISQLLEELDLTGCQDGRDSEKALLDGLKHFKLPSFIGYRFLRNKKFEVYLEDAIEFFSYDMFKEDRARKKGLETIAKFIKENEDKIINNECFDEIVRIPYNTDGEFIEGLREYIEEEASECREKLLNCDFVTVRDHILKFKKKGSTPSKKIKKLSGGPIEVLLHAVWLTLGEFKAAAANLGEFAHEAIEKIVIEPTLYKHDYEAEIGSEVESVEDRNQRAISYLMRLIGGVDTYLTQHVNLSAACGDNHQAALECRLENQEVRCQYARTAEPCLEFSVTISGVGWDEPVSRKFAWRLPEIHPYRLADELILWAVKEKRGCRDAWHLPVFHVPYYDELMLARDDEEIRRVLSQCIKDKGGNAFNLLSATGAERGGALLKHLQALAGAYDQFLVKAKEDGLHASLLYNWNSLRQAYEKALGSYIHDKECENNPLAPMLLRAFLIIKRCHAAEGDSWVWRPYEQSGVVTVLHPALLEMLEAHILYLFACFNSALVTELRAPAQNAFKESTWQSYTDLAEIQMPLTGLICDRNKILDTNVRGEGLIHRIGNIDESEATLTTRLLLKYEAFEDDEITDADIFRETRESKLLYRMMHDYRKMHPHAEDGLSIAVSRNKDIQPVIAAVHSYLTDLWEQGRQDREFYAMSVTIFTESSDDSSVSRWIEQWKERWEYAENDGKLAHYRKSRLSVSHRIISSERYYQQFIALIKEGLEVDIVFLYDFIGAGMDGNDFKKVSAYDATSHTLKFPILEKPFCSSNEPGRQLQRARILSNRQFRLSTLHAEIMARFKHPTTPQSLEHVVLGFGDYTPWQGVIDAFHNRAEWIVCIDPNIDERLIEKRGQETGITREIIGFGSGVGSHGEANYTVSTEQFALADVHHRLKASIAEIYPQWQSLGCEQVAKSVLEETRKLSGLSLV